MKERYPRELEFKKLLEQATKNCALTREAVIKAQSVGDKGLCQKAGIEFDKAQAAYKIVFDEAVRARAAFRKAQGWGVGA